MLLDEATSLLGRGPVTPIAKPKNAADRRPRPGGREVEASQPEIARQSWEGYADELTILRIPATPVAIDHLIETTRWLLWLDESQRRLV